MEEFLKDNFKLLLWVAVVGNALVILVYKFRRAPQGKQRAAIHEHDIRFSEKWVSGASQKNVLTKLGGARNCLAVVLSNKALIVRPMFPFNLPYFSEVYDFEHYIPRNEIRCIRPDESEGKGRVVIEYGSENGEKQIELVLRKKQEFLRAVGIDVPHHPVPSGSFT